MTEPRLGEQLLLEAQVSCRSLLGLSKRWNLTVTDHTFIVSDASDKIANVKPVPINQPLKPGRIEFDDVDAIIVGETIVRGGRNTNSYTFRIHDVHGHIVNTTTTSQYRDRGRKALFLKLKDIGG